MTPPAKKNVDTRRLHKMCLARRLDVCREIFATTARSVHQNFRRRGNERASIPHRWSCDMSDKTSDRQNDANGKSETQSDSEKALQEELRREAAEGKSSIGDAGRNNNL